MEKRTALAFFLSLLVLIASNAYFAKKFPKKQIEERKEISKKENAQTSALQKEILPAFPKVPEKKHLVAEIPVETDLYKLILSGEGAVLKLGLKNFRREGEDFFSVIPADLPFCPLEFTGWGKEIHFSADKKSLLLNKENEIGKVALKGKTKDGLIVTKSFSFNNDGYGFDLAIKIENVSAQEKSLANIGILCGSGFSSSQKKPSGRDPDIEEDQISVDGKINRFSTRKFKKKQTIAEIEWIAQKSQYCLLFLQPKSKTDAFIYPEEKRLILGVNFPSIIIPENGIAEKKLFFYGGPADYEIAKAEEKGVEKTLEGGFFVTLGRFILKILTFLYQLVGNWGWAIIILTILVKIFLFPLSRSSVRSISQMQKLQPYLKDLKTKYKGNTQLMNKEMMELYRKYKINPLGGCLPMLAQMPIFIAFFFALRSAIILRGAKFMFWIKDLSLPDTVLAIPNFPGGGINILPVLMGASMLIQQKMTTTDPNQKMMALMMPIFFTFIFYSFSSGLLLYWLVMNILSIAEQRFVSGKK